MADSELDDGAQTAIIRRVIDGVMTALDRLDVGQHLHTEIGREGDGDDPGYDERKAHDPEDVAGIFACGRFGKTHGHQSDDRDQRAGQHRRCRMAPGIGGRLDAVHALFHLHHHHFDGNDGIVN